MKKNYIFILITIFSFGFLLAQDNDTAEVLIVEEGIDNVIYNDNLVSYVNVYPNPGIEFIKINVAGDFNEVILKAQTQEQFILPADNKIVDISKLHRGIYTISIKTKDHIYLAKLFKK